MSDKVQSAFRELETVFTVFKNGKTSESNKYPVGDPNRVEHDFSIREKSHLDLLTAKLHMEIGQKLNESLNKASESSEKLGMKLHAINRGMLICTILIALAAVLQLVVVIIFKNP